MFCVLLFSRRCSWPGNVTVGWVLGKVMHEVRKVRWPNGRPGPYTYLYFVSLVLSLLSVNTIWFSFRNAAADFQRVLCRPPDSRTLFTSGHVTSTKIISGFNHIAFTPVGQAFLGSRVEIRLLFCTQNANPTSCFVLPTYRKDSGHF